MKVQIFIMALALASSTAHGDSSISLLWHPQANSYNSHSIFHTPDEYVAQPRYNSQLVAEITHYSTLQQLDISLLASVQQQSQSGGSPQSDADINELTAGYNRGEWEFAIGRKIHSWGVGYSFRPLDIIQQTNQQRTSRQSLIGQDGITADYYSDNSSVSLLLLAATRHNRYPDNPTIAGRYFITQGQHDLQLVGQYNHYSKTQVGAGGVSIINDNLALHGSMLYQQHYTQMINTLAEQGTIILSRQNPYQPQDHNNGIQAVIGLSYATDNSQSFIAEYSYDSTVYTQQQWQAIYTLATQQQALLNDPLTPKSATLGNIAWSALASQYATRPQHSLMLQWQYEGEQWQPRINTLLAIEDRSHMTTLTLQRQFDSINFDIGIRHFSGKTNSFYGESILNNTIYATFSSEF